MPQIDYESEGFPASSPVTNGSGMLDVPWDDILWAAITVGRPNRQFVFQHGVSSDYEALFRWSLVRMAIEQTGPSGTRFRRTMAAKCLDPSEKGAVSYFLGMAVCKLFASKLLNAPWLLHLDVFRPQLNPELQGRSRPDLIGQAETGEWLSVESKGRISAPSSEAKDKAKDQAKRCVSVNGTPVTYRIGGITYFSGNVLRFYWRDPKPNRIPPTNSFQIQFDDRLWRYYYEPAWHAFQSAQPSIAPTAGGIPVAQIQAADVSIGIHYRLTSFFRNEAWSEAKEWCVRNAADLELEGYRRDGLCIVAGPSWGLRFADPGT